MKKHFRSMRVFYRYLMSHCGIALLCCAILGIFLFSTYVAEYEDRIYAGEVQKARAVLSDLDAQVEWMGQISYSVKNDIKLSYVQLRASNYEEYSMLQEFSRYSTDNTFSESYFLFYQGEDRIYSSAGQWESSQGATYDAQLFFASVLEAADPQALYAALSEMKRQAILPVEGSDAVLFCYPLSLVSASVNSVLCFRVSQAQIEGRMRLVSGGDDAYLLRAGEIQLFCPAGHEDDAAARGARLVQMESASGRFSLEMVVNTSLTMRDLHSYQSLLVYAALLCLLLLLITAIIAYQQSKPLQRIIRLIRSGTGDGKCASDEMADIEARLRDMLEMSEKYHLRFQRQMRLLREQMLRLLLCGEYSEALSATLTQMDISFDGRFVGAAVVLFPEEMPQHSSQQALIAQIEDLSTEDIAFYACPGSRDNSIDLVLSLEECEGNAALGAMAMLQDLLRAEGILARMGCGSLYPDVRQLAASRAEAKDALAQGRVAPLTLAGAHRHFERILGSVRMGDAANAAQQLDAFVQEADMVAQSLMQQRCLLIDLLNMLLSAAQEMGVAISSRQMSVVMTGGDLGAILEGMRELISFLCACKARENGDDGKTIHKVLDYIRAHCLENDLSLDSISAQFGITAGYVSRLVRSSVGCGYKEYVMRLRMERACAFLQQGMSVGDTCRNCGYVNISHFIKTFKQFSGTTPSNYSCEFKQPDANGDRHS